MIIKNATEQNIIELTKKIEEIKKNNPYIESKTFTENEEIINNLNLYEIKKEIKELKCKLDLIFGGHVLHNGNFIKIENKMIDINNSMIKENKK